MNKHESKYEFSKSLMEEALLKLLETKDFEYITIKELTKLAGVNRSTFYLHYSSLNELLEETTEDINKDFYSYFDNKVIDFKDNKESVELLSREYLKPYLEFILNNQKIFKLYFEKANILNSKSNLDFIEKNYFIPLMDLHNIDDNLKPYLITFYINSIISIIKKWLENNCNIEIDELLNIIYYSFSTGSYFKKYIKE